ncbi:hypothetical protein GCM10010246_81540 [Streptomyces cuspidosporus]|uniref:Core-binding (CB) domain-containing protein n=1 Tax=Streptomyces cuspidosporus TaxID=66882 RepID=A0ABN3HCP2_9ACTN
MASQSPERGRVYRRCGCRRPDGRQFGASCPRLQDGSRHGSWAFAVDLPSADGKRHPLCRSGLATRKAGKTALERALESERTGLDCSEDLTLATYLAEWLRLKEKVLKPTTFARYRDHVHADLIPSFRQAAPDRPAGPAHCIPEILSPRCGNGSGTRRLGEAWW